MTRAALDALLDRLVPADSSSPGARELGIGDVVLDRFPAVGTMLNGLDGFEALAPEEQEAALEAIAADAEFAYVVDAVHAAYYADPRSWPAIGYSTNVPGRP